MHATELAHKRPALTAQHRENFRKLADYVLNLPDDYKGFSMVEYCRTIAPPVSTGGSRDWQPQQAKNVVEKHKCGTSACMLGHGPAAGIAPRNTQHGGSTRTQSLGVTPTTPLRSSSCGRGHLVVSGHTARLQGLMRRCVSSTCWTTDYPKPSNDLARAGQQ